MEIIEVKNLRKTYMTKKKNGEILKQTEVLKNIDLTIQEKEFIGIMGKSGCGKTTLLKILGLIDEPTEGKVFFKGEDSDEIWGDKRADIRRNEIGFIFQDYFLLDGLDVRENIMLPMSFGFNHSDKIKKLAEDFASRFGIQKLLEKQIYELSGGEKQRVAICRALMNSPELILADEPTGNLDSHSGESVMESLQQINEEMGKTVVLVTHDSRLASYCHKIFFLKDGEILETIKRKHGQQEFYDEIVEKVKCL